MKPKPAYEACVIAASAGGVGALMQVLSGLGANLPLAVVVLLHTASGEDGLAEVLGSRCVLPVSTAEPSEAIAPGRVWVAPSGYHLLVERDHHFSLSVDDKVCFVRPSADVLFESAADAWRERLIGVILTGGNHDGAAGLREIRSRGGLAIVQEPGEAEARAMPEAAIATAGADHVLPLKKIGPLIDRLARA